jgi:ABC-type transporter Mla subunit MlaD
MATRANHVKIGIFVLLGAAAALALAVSLGATAGRREKIAFYTYLDESVQGLDVGAPVTFRGVRIGQVGDITIAPDHRLVALRMDIDVNSMEQLGLLPKGALKSGQGFPPPRPDLRTQLGSLGLTGNKYLSVDFFDPKTAPPPVLPFPAPEHYIPATRSLTKGLEDSLQKAVDRITVLADHATAVLDSLGRVVGALDEGGAGDKASRALGEAERALRGVNGLLAGVERAQLVENAGATVRGLRRSADDLNRVLGHLDGDHGLLATTQGSLASIGQAGRDVAGATRDLDATLSEVREAASAFRQLADEIERQPDALLKGRARETRP